MKLTLPRGGLQEVAAGWMGPGRLIDALATVERDGDEHTWSESDIRRRVNRMLLARLATSISRLPHSIRHWEQYLPITVRTEESIGRTPSGKVNWVATTRYHGWPASQYIGQRHRRVLSEAPLTALVWVSIQLRQLLPETDPPLLELASVKAQSVALHGLVARHLGGLPALRPDRLELRALSTSAYPWRDVAYIAATIDRAQRDPEFLAFDLLEPDPDADLQWRLFHVASFGLTVAALRKHRHRITWRSPIGGTRAGPQVITTSSSGEEWHVWFEAAAARSYYGLPASTYHDVVAYLSDVPKSLGPDILLVSPFSRALVLECKWSSDPHYVARDGYHQVSSYALDVLDQLAPEVWAIIVGPDEIIPRVTAALGAWNTLSLILGLAPATKVDTVIGAFLSSDPYLLLGESDAPATASMSLS